MVLATIDAGFCTHSAAVLLAAMPSIERERNIDRAQNDSSDAKEHHGKTVARIHDHSPCTVTVKLTTKISMQSAAKAVELAFAS